MRRLLQPKNILVDTKTKRGKYISILNIIQGDVDPYQVHKSLQRIRERNLANFITWGPASIQVALSQKSPYVPSTHKVTGMMLANNTSIRHIFDSQRKDYNHLMSRKAHTFKYEQTKPFSGKLDEFNESEEVVRSLVEEYQAAEHDNYVQWGQ